MISTSTSSNIEALRKQRLDLDFEVPEETNSDLIAPPLINDEEFNQTSTSSQSVTVCDESVLSETSFLKVAGTIKFKSYDNRDFYFCWTSHIWQPNDPQLSILGGSDIEAEETQVAPEFGALKNLQKIGGAGNISKFAQSKFNKFYTWYVNFFHIDIIML